tara:strand:- start:1409 stop:2173 length:765 start_codon:yes stop_codon:yes gene_type:complete
MKNFIFKQGGGLGDILFCLKIAKKLFEKYECKITWPVFPSILWIRDYIKIPYIEWVSYEQYSYLNNYPYKTPVKLDDNLILVPIACADLPNMSVMESKYVSLGIGFENWQDSINIYRNKEQEDSLYYDVLGLKDNEEYTYIHREYGTPDKQFSCGAIKSPFMNNIQTSGKVIEGFIDPKYTVFDWIKVIENAKELHLVHTSLFYIIEALTNKLPEINLYNRGDRYSHWPLNFLRHTLRQKWNFVDYNVPPHILS